jgi:hypothetical protein
LNPGIVERYRGGERHSSLDRYGHLFERFDERIAEGLDEFARGSRGLGAAWTSFS